MQFANEFIKDEESKLLINLFMSLFLNTNLNDNFIIFLILSTDNNNNTIIIIIIIAIVMCEQLSDEGKKLAEQCKNDFKTLQTGYLSCVLCVHV